METIFHEKQEGSLCAQHCLNALLQNQYFSAVDLAQIGHRLDERERERMAEGGISSNEYQRFIEEPSNNYDDSGFFSVQVITEALSVWGLDMVLYNSQDPISVQARLDPTQMSAFICNYHQHWFCIRKLGHQWFNLNSLLSGPELISDTYLALFLTQLQQEVNGELPECEADHLLRLMPAVQTVKPRLLTEKEDGGDRATDKEEEEDGVLMEALRVSRELIDNDDTALQRALQLSMEGFSVHAGSSDQSTGSGNITDHGETDLASSELSQTLSQEELRQKRMTFLTKQMNNVDPSCDTGQSPESGRAGDANVEPTDEELLAKAIAMSMENS